MRRGNLLAVVTALALGLAAPVQAGGDVDAGRAKSADCVGCHGRNGKSTNPRNPNLAGQKEFYLVKALKAYRDGKRKDATMSPFAAELSDEDIADLAAFFSRVK